MSDLTQVHHMTPAEVKAKLDAGEKLFILDLRNTEEFEAWKIESPNPLPMMNAPYYEILAEADDPEDIQGTFAGYAKANWADQLPNDSEILVICAKGSTSGYAAEGLQTLGYKVSHLEGGMIAWGDYYDFKPVLESGTLSVYQVIRPARGCLSYVIASGSDAIIVDPLRHTERYLEFAQAKGLTYKAVLDTHGHADHISGGPALSEQLSIPYYFHPYDAIHPIDVLPATIAYEPLKGDQDLTFGAIELKAIHIPGHTLGNIAYLVNGAYLLSGDSIFIESIARPDLGGRGDVWSPIHFKSLSKLLALPDETVVLPGHFSHPSEANGTGLYADTLGSLKAKNEGLKMVQQGQESFVSYLLSSLPTFPPQYVDIKRVNAGLLEPDEEKASELELGRNICALSQAYKDS